MKKVTIELFSDVLCIWAYGAQARIDQLKADYGDRIELHYRFIPVFAAAHQRIEQAWQEQDGYAGFNRHLHESASGWEHVTLHPDLWLRNPPRSSQLAHLYLKALQLLDEQHDSPRVTGDQTIPTRFEEFLWRVRCAFFRDAEDISRLATLDALAQEMDLPVPEIHRKMNDGSAHADLHLDTEARDRYLVPGSPTLVFNEGRQRLYGNVGYRIIDVNIRELLRDTRSGEASWC
ncbi:MAG TPA: disulfide bond formation protein DsbA [Gammaproteobacteria bacterium]|nr:disulfide bond formation protein DsbA [Gammaproteobacteria bacterium]